MTRKILLGGPLAFSLGYGSTLVWQNSLEAMLRRSGAEVIPNPAPEALWIGLIFCVVYAVVLGLQAYRSEFRGAKKLAMVCFFSWLGANLGVALQAMGIASKELPKQLGEQDIPKISMSAYPYVNWASFGLISGLFLVGLLMFFANLLRESEAQEI